MEDTDETRFKKRKAGNQQASRERVRMRAKRAEAQAEWAPDAVCGGGVCLTEGQERDLEKLVETVQVNGGASVAGTSKPANTRHGLGFYTRACPLDWKPSLLCRWSS
jgi:TPP-dependent trihydroxycyclohexane-1,2-dione (THcHDO) dehydratase